MLPLIPLALSVAPQLAKWLFGDDGEKTAATVVDTVKQVTGAVDDISANAALAKDPKVMAELQQALAKIAADKEAAAEAARMETLKAQLADVANARQQTVDLAKTGSKIAWSATIVSAVILVAFGSMLYVVLTRAIPDGSLSLANVLLGTLAAMAAQVGNYWLGSSRGSAEKAEHIEKLTGALAGK